jgi:mono/diheme cytochrome c family protein
MTPFVPDRHKRAQIMLGLALVTLLTLVPFFSGVYAQQTLSERVYTDAQARRGQSIYVEKCASCHAQNLQGGLGPPLAGNNFVDDWDKEPVSELVTKIEKTMPQTDPGTLSRQQAVDVVSYILKIGSFPAGQKELSSDDKVLKQVMWPTRSTPEPNRNANAATPRSYAPSGNLAQVMRGILFPSSNLIFNVQGHDPGVKLPPPPDDTDTIAAFNWAVWGSGIYSGWELVDYAAIALAESAPLLLTPGRRCENGKPVPINDPEWIKFTDELVEAGRAAYKASQTRDAEKVADVTDKVADSCANCHQLYRDKNPRVINPDDPSNKALRCAK